MAGLMVGLLLLFLINENSCNYLPNTDLDETIIKSRSNKDKWNQVIVAGHVCQMRISFLLSSKIGLRKIYSDSSKFIHT